MRALILIGAVLIAACASPSRRTQTNVVSLRAALGGVDEATRARAAFALGQLGLTEIPEGAPEPPTLISLREAAAAAREHGLACRMVTVDGDGAVRHVGGWGSQQADVVFVEGGLTEAQLPVLYRSVDVMVLPTFAEAFGLSAAEYMITLTTIGSALWFLVRRGDGARRRGRASGSRRGRR